MIPVEFPSTDRLIYKSDNLIAYYSPSCKANELNILCITFFPFISPMSPSAPRKGQSRETIRDAGIDAIHVIPVASDWYQYPDFNDLLYKIHEYAVLYKELVCYGQSMGAYAALHSSAILKPNRVLAICPQYSIDTKKIDFSTGFEKDARRLIFCRDDFEINCDSNAELIIAYDPLFATDKNHFTLIKAHRNNIFPLVMPFCGHSVSESLYNAGLLPHALASLLTSGKNSIGEIRKTFRANRNNVYRYKCIRLSLICQRAVSRGEIKKATQYSRELIRLKPDFNSYRTYCEIAEKYLSAEEASSRWLESITRLGNSAPVYAYVRAIIFLRKCDDINVYQYKCLRLSLLCQRAASRGKIKKATQYSRKLIRLKPEFSSYRTYCEIAEKYLSAEEASSRWLESITRLGNSAPAYAYVRSIIFLRQCDDMHAAEHICTEGLARHPDDFGLKREQINVSLKTNTNKVKGMIYEFKSKFEDRAIPYLKSISNLIDINDVDLN